MIEEVFSQPEPHRFIIAEDSFLNMIKNDIVFLFFVVYSIYLPLVISFDTVLQDDNYSTLLMFDCIFIFDRFSDLFQGFINKKGVLEPSLIKTILNNISFIFFFEIFITVIPSYFREENGELDSFTYFLIKTPRIKTMLDSSQQIEEILRVIGEKMTVFELKYIEERL